MKREFAPGLSDEMTIVTTPEMGITHLGPNVPSMYSTPAMVQFIVPVSLVCVTVALKATVP